MHADTPPPNRSAPRHRTCLRAAATAAGLGLALTGCSAAGPVAAPSPTAGAAPAYGATAGAAPSYGAPAGATPTTSDLALAATQAFRVDVQTTTAALSGAVGALQADVARGDTAAARSDELSAQAAFDGVRALEAGNPVNASTLDQLATDVPAGQTFGGLHAVERDLWAGGPAAADLASLAPQVTAAQFLLSHLRLTPEAIGVVAADELGWVVDDALPADQEQYSGLGLVDVAASVAAAQQAAAALAPLADRVAPQLAATAAAQFTTLEARTAALGSPRQVPESTVPRAVRRALSQQLDATASTLAGLAAALSAFGTVGPTPYGASDVGS